MRLTESSGTHEMPSYIFGPPDRILEDMRTMYGIAHTQLVDDAPDGCFWQTLPVAVILAGVASSEVVINISDLGQKENAMRWTALQAYRARGGAAFGFLSTEVQGPRGAEEWTNRYAARLNGSLNRMSEPKEAVDFFAAVAEGSDDGKTAAYLESILDTTAPQSGLFINLYRAIADRYSMEFDLDMIFEAGYPFHRTKTPWAPATHTQFLAASNTLPGAARILEREYGKLCFHADNADMTVSSALGVEALGQLNSLWERAMQGLSPVAAGRFVLASLGS